jgi:hypothetical protein
MDKCAACGKGCNKMLTADGKPVCDGSCAHSVFYGVRIPSDHPIFGDHFVFESVKFG